MWTRAVADAATSSGGSASLVLSITALAISAAVAGWNVLKYILDGGRVRVRLERGYLDETALFSAPFRNATKVATGLRPPSRLHVEVGVLKVENLGRTAVTIFDPSFDLGSKWSWRRLRFGRWTIAPMALSFKEARTTSTVRIDPFDFATFVLDAEPAFTSAGPQREGKPRRIRASVGVGGKRFRRRSSWWQGWKVAAGARTLGEPVAVDLVVYRDIYRWQNGREGEDGRFVAAFAAQRVQDAWNKGEQLDLENITGLITDAWTRSDDDQIPMSVAINLHISLVRHGLIDLGGNKRDAAEDDSVH